MKNIVAERIQARLEALGKNPSGVALEAGLGRSSVRDIITGRVSSSRLDTLRRLTGPLECTLDYLTGDSDDPKEEGLYRRYIEMDVMSDLLPTPAEAGVFRPVLPGDERRTQLIELFSKRSYSATRDYRIPTWDVALYEMMDNSMEDVHIVKGDVLVVATPPYDQQIPLTDGTLVACRRNLRIPELEEISVRQIVVSKTGISLVCRARPMRIIAIEIPEHSIDNESKIIPNFYPLGDSSVEIIGVVTRVERQIILSDAVHDLSVTPIDE
jgi:hypothetical protein